MKKLFHKNKRLILIILILLLPILISIGLLYLIFGNLYDALIKMFELRGKPNITKDAITSLSYIWTFILTIYSIVITSFFSYLVWKVSKDSLLVSKDLKNLEEKRDSENEREQALIVYYDLQHGFSYLRDLYISLLIKNQSPNPARIFFSDDWIKNVATLRNKLTRPELNQVYQLYNDFFTIQSLLENTYSKDNDQIAELRDFTKQLGRKVFPEFLPLQRIEEFKSSSIEDLIDIDWYILIHKIHQFTYPEKQIVKRKTGNDSYEVLINGINSYSVKSGDIRDGEGIVYTSNGEEKAIGYFAQGKFMTGKVFGYINPNEKYYSINYETTTPTRNIVSGYVMNPNGDKENKYFYNGYFCENKVFNGFTTEFHSNDEIKFSGNVVNGLRDGYGTSFSSKGKLWFKGIYKQNEKYKGELYNEKGSFNGIFKDGRPWEGNVKRYDFPNQYILAFDGEIREGKPYIGEGLMFKQSSMGEDLEERYANDNWEPDEQHWQMQEENDQSLINENIRKNYSDWDDYIKTDWNEGIPMERESIENNITVYYRESSKL
ncbi:toxin-antitoxin system YwqK family antitoxin [Priestia megaterium]|uniref:toxin-antitoxin system YwqK family antitoxin n=1 Tax=Priestia megaterium TaxID=1404 RepID=UPI00188DF57C|nr:hypothetical protein [Priestia megaterium]